MAPTTWLLTLGHACRRVAAAIIAGLWRRGDAEAVEVRLRALPVRDQAAIVAAVLLGLFLASLVAAQFGVVGLLAFLLLVVLVVG